MISWARWPFRTMGASARTLHLFSILIQFPPLAVLAVGAGQRGKGMKCVYKHAEDNIFTFLINHLLTSIH